MIGSPGDSFATSRAAACRLLLIVVGLGAGALGLTAATASAAPAFSPHAFTTYFGAASSTPSNPYPLSNPTDVAADRSTHDFYVTDTGNHRVEKFDSSGHLLLMFGRNVNRTKFLAKAGQRQQDVCVPSVDQCQTGATNSTSAPGSLNTPAFVVVDNSSGPSAGDVYVADILGSLVSKFDSAGNLIGNWRTAGQLPVPRGITGIAVSVGGDLVVMDGKYQYFVYRYAQSGSPISEFVLPIGNLSDQIGFAVDENERFYKSGGYITEFRHNEVIFNIGPENGPPTGFTIDPMSNDLYIDEGGAGIGHIESQCGQCPPLETFGKGKLSEAHGISIDAPSNDVYVANSGEDDVAVFGGTAPIAATAPASTVGRTTATVTGHLSTGGRGAITGCAFEYGTNDLYETGSVPCVPGGPYGSEADVTAELTGLQPETTYHYRLTATNASGTALGADRTTTPHFVIDANTGPAVAITTNGAELTGSYTGDGHDTKYHFEYGPTDAYGSSSGEQDDGTGTGHRDLAPQSITGLLTFTTYHYRLVAVNSLGTTYGQDRTFTTFDRPGIESFSSANVTATSAELRALIDPRGGGTTYHFEYGLTAGYGSSAPSPDEDIGSTPGSQEVSVTLTNLQVGATYHFRVVAENPFGTAVSEDQEFGFYPPSCPNATVRQETASNYLPDCRGYELVSPPEVGNVTLYPAGPNSPDAINPPRFSFGGWLGLAPGTGEPVNGWGDLYVSTRTAAGWTTRYVGLRGSETNVTNGPPGDPTNTQFTAAPNGVRTNSDMSEFVDWNLPDLGFTEEPLPLSSHIPHVWAADGTSLGEWPTSTGHTVGPILNQSADFSHYYFLDGGVSGYEGTAYDNDVANGTVAPIGFSSDETPIEVRGVAHSSDDGTRVLMSTASCRDLAASSCAPGELFMRVNDALTYDIAKGHTLQYVGMTADGATVYFTSPDQLTVSDKDSSTDLYMWSEETNSLILVSVGNEGNAGNSDACSAGWVEKCGAAPIISNVYVETERGLAGGLYGNGLSDNAVASTTGDIYFYSPERLDGAKGIANQVNLYVYRNGAVQYVTTLEPGGVCQKSYPFYCTPGPVARVQVTPDGSSMALLTASRVTAYDNAQHTEMYTFSPDSGEVLCVSCKPDGVAPISDVWASSDGSFMTNDGRTFFGTRDWLVPRDTDEVRDVYEYVGGHAQLISSGTSEKDFVQGLAGSADLYTAGLVGVSSDGTNVYFSTFDTLVPQDQNGNFLKFYDARSNGGFSFIAPPAPCEAADECVSSGTSPPAIPAATSGAGLGAGGNATPQAKGRKHKKKRHRHSKAKKPVGHSGGRSHG